MRIAPGVRALRARAVRPGGAAPRLARRGDAVRRRALHCARRSCSRSAISGRTPPRWRRRGGSARAWLDSPAAERADLARIALPLAAKRGDAALFDRLFGRRQAARRRPRPACSRSVALAAFDDPALIERTLGAGARRHDQDAGSALPVPGVRAAARRRATSFTPGSSSTSTSWRACFRRSSMGRIVRAVPALCDARARARRRGVPAAARREAGEAWRRTCASRWRRGCAAPRSPTPARADAVALAPRAADDYDRPGCVAGSVR